CLKTCPFSKKTYRKRT
ncbi:hypothetical protein Trydic_g12735, partial [Trypoxylus dichotomus]